MYYASMCLVGQVRDAPLNLEVWLAVFLLITYHGQPLQQASRGWPTRLVAPHIGQL